MEIFFSGQIDKDRALTYFSHIDVKPNSILNVFDSFKQRMFLDSTYEIFSSILKKNLFKREQKTLRMA